MTDDPTTLTRAILRDAESGLTAAFVPSAGMIGVSLRDGDAELLGQRRGLGAYVADGKTMGIPFLHPWANRLSGRHYEAAGVAVDLADGAPGVRLDPNGLPIHGLLAAAPGWRVEPLPEAGEPVDRLTASFDLADRPDLLASFPYPHEVELDVQLRGGVLRIATTVIATTDRAVPLAFGFHPYLTLPGVPREDWIVGLPAMRHRPVDALGLPTGAAEPVSAERFRLGDRTYDDGYDAVPAGAAFTLEGGGRLVTVTFDEGYPAAQVFAPPGDALLCFEPMAAPTNALVSGDGLRCVEPGAPAASTFSIAVTRTA